MLFNADATTTNVKDYNAGVFSQWAFTWQDLTAFLGARLDYLKFESDSQVFPTEQSFTEPTFRLGGIYALNSKSSIFANYSESISPQFDLEEIESSPNEDNDPLEVIRFPAPARSSQIEIGIKNTWFEEQLQSSCAAYQITKSEIDSVIQQQRNRGLECDLVGSIGRYWHLNLGASLLDAEITQSSEEDFIGNRPRISPKSSASLWLSRDISWLNDRWEGRFGARLSYINERFIAVENETLLPSYTLLDLSANLSFNSHVQLSFIVRNVLNKEFTQGVFNALPFWRNPGASRTFEARLTYFY